MAEAQFSVFGARAMSGRKSAARASALPLIAGKIRKRVGQLVRLGPSSFARAAYIKTLGRTVHSSLDYARAVASRIHRRKTRNHAVEIRAERLKRRLQFDAPSAALRAPLGTVRLDFGEDRGRLVQALEAMLDLADAGCAVPRPVHVDWGANSITVGPAKGKKFRQQIESGRASLDLVAQIEKALLAIHRAGYVLDRVNEDSLLVAPDGRRVVVTGLAHAIPLAGLSRDMSVYLRDRDSKKFNQLFGTRLLTASHLRKAESAPLTRRAPGEDDEGDSAYASIVIRDDVHWGNIFNPDVGTARWNYILEQHVPVPHGGRILDLGCNIGLNPLQMLRHGAASAIAIDNDEDKVGNAQILKAAFEWLDNRSYDFRFIHCSFADLPTLDLGRFDVVTALCSLYYLGEQEMRDLVNYIRTITDTLVLQCNTDRLIDRTNGDTYRKASVEFAVEVLEQARFAKIEIIAPTGYSRPLVIGSTP